jgi:hypothetical protein
MSKFGDLQLVLAAELHPVGVSTPGGPWTDE